MVHVEVSVCPPIVTITVSPVVHVPEIVGVELEVGLPIDMVGVAGADLVTITEELSEVVVIGPVVPPTVVSVSEKAINPSFVGIEGEIVMLAVQVTETPELAVHDGVTDCPPRVTFDEINGWFELKESVTVSPFFAYA